MEFHEERSTLAKAGLDLTVVAALMVTIVWAQSSLCRQGKKLPSRRPPDLSLKIIPAKTIYTLHERLHARYELTNQSDETLCFPPPDGCDFATSGSVPNADGTGGVGVGIGCGAERSKPRDLLSDVEQRWVKLPPNQTHLTQDLSGIEFTNLGKWDVESDFRPLELSGEEMGILKAVGCRVPEGTISPPSVQIQVVEPSPEK
jgi:hypothetical protein